MGGAILIVDDVATNRIILKVKLAAACYTVVQADSGAAALQLARQEKPSLILLDVQLPDISGLTICQRLKADPVTRDIPVIVVTAFDDCGARLRALEAGADDFMSKPVDEMVLLARIRSLMRARENEEELRLRGATCRELGFAEASQSFQHTARIALIARSVDTAMDWRHALLPHLDARIDILTAAEALEARTTRPAHDLYLIAANLDGSGSGLRLMSELRSRPDSRHAAITIVLNSDTRETAAMALDLGANELLREQFNPEETALRLRRQLQRKRQADQLRTMVTTGLRLAVTDALTGLYNRRYALPHLERIAERAQQTGRQFAVMVLDLDRFKSINDTWGHAAGDVVLVEISRRLRDSLRPSDMVARFGGEEFLVALPDTSLDTAKQCAERLCRVVEETPVQLPDSPDQVRVTISIGLALGPGGGTGTEADTVNKLLSRADWALMAAKGDGRNQVTVSRSAA